MKFLEGDYLKTLKLKKTTPAQNYCEENPQLNIIHDSQFTQKEFSAILKKIKDSDRYSIAELGLLFYFYQMTIRPDATDEYSRIQVIIREKQKLFYRDFLSRDGPNLINTIETLKSEGLIKKSIRQLLKKKQAYFPKKFIVQKKLSDYLSKRNSNSEFNQKLKDTFFRVGKPLQKGESFQSTKVLKAVTGGRVIAAPPLFPIRNDKNSDAQIECSFDSKLYQNGIFLLNKEKSETNIFGLLRSNGDTVFFITKKDNSIGKGFTGKATKSNAAVCFHKDRDKTLDLIGFNSRDPGQILYHLFNYKINTSHRVADVTEYLIFPRHQFLTNPSRLIYESKKGTRDQLNYFLSFNFPVYHIENLSVVYALFKNKSRERTFIADSRYETFQSCKK